MRDPYWDNLKAVLIILVVLGHYYLAEYVYAGECDWALPTALISFIYMFHMPLFAFVSGRFTKNVRDARDNGFDIIIAGAGGVCALVAWYSRQPAFRNVFAVCKFLMTAPAA